MCHVNSNNLFKFLILLSVYLVLRNLQLIVLMLKGVDKLLIIEVLSFRWCWCTCCWGTFSFCSCVTSFFCSTSSDLLSRGLASSSSLETPIRLVCLSTTWRFPGAWLPSLASAVTEASGVMCSAFSGTGSSCGVKWTLLFRAKLWRCSTWTIWNRPDSKSSGTSEVTNLEGSDFEPL